MNGTLPGLLDDPTFANADLPPLNDFRIAPLRNPAPLQSNNVRIPFPIEPVAGTADRARASASVSTDRPGHDVTANVNATRRTASISPSDVLSAREGKKPHLTISELVDPGQDVANDSLQLPSFVSLSVVEKSPVPQPSNLTNGFPNKRPRLDTETASASSHDHNRFLPRPAQKDDKQQPAVPLLPAMVTGLHEPPPSAALLPPIATDTHPPPPPVRHSHSKMQVKDLLDEPQKASTGRPPEQMLNTPEVTTMELPMPTDVAPASLAADMETLPSLFATKKEPKVRRARRKWSEDETQQLFAGVRKHGFGRWKQIATDPEYIFHERTAMDLKDRFRVFAKEQPGWQHLTSRTGSASPHYQEASATTPPDGSDDLDLPRGGRMGSVSSASGQPSSSAKPRRKRHPWSKAEDNALLQGVTKHGFQWTDIHNDPDLKLSHRRATDLRDRIRNLYPQGYRQAEARPLRSELIKAEKAAKKEGAPGPSSVAGTTTNTTITSPNPSTPQASQRQGSAGYNKGPSIADLTTSDSIEAEPERSSLLRRTKTGSSDMALADHNGVTLPSLPIGVGDSADDWNNTLPPFLGWDEPLGD